MAMTLEEIKNKLSAIEPESDIFAGIGPSEIPVLKRLLADKEPWLASRAVFALSRLSDPRALAVLSDAAADPRQEVRVSVAASARSLKPKDASDLLMQLLDDPEMGVRKFAVQSVSKAHRAAVIQKVKDISTGDPALPMRAIV